MATLSMDDWSRRKLLIAGSAALAGLALPSGASRAQPASAGPAPGFKPVQLPPPGSVDPVAHALAETRFWTDILSEHGMFFALLLPGADLARERADAESFQARFADLRARAMSLEASDPDGVRALARSVSNEVTPFAEWKLRMRDAQATGRIHGLAWPMFFEHTAHEAERFRRRLGQILAGSVEHDRAEVLEFWGMVMGEHALFIAHLLDPDEVDLINRAYDAREAFQSLRAQAPPVSLPDALGLAEDMVDFKSAAERGILAGTLKSIIHPALADHVRREAVKFVDELRALDPGAVAIRPPRREPTSRVPGRGQTVIRLEGPPRYERP